jgi:hypothetical protein
LRDGCAAPAGIVGGTIMSALQTRREAQGGHRQRSVRECVSEIETGATALSELAHGWLVFLPRPTALSGAEATVEGLRRLVAELRQQIAAPVKE